jgi:hypothetical protein
MCNVQLLSRVVAGVISVQTRKQKDVKRRQLFDNKKELRLCEAPSSFMYNPIDYEHHITRVDTFWYHET